MSNEPVPCRCCMYSIAMRGIGYCKLCYQLSPFQRSIVSAIVREIARAHLLDAIRAMESEQVQNVLYRIFTDYEDSINRETDRMHVDELPTLPTQRVPRQKSNFLDFLKGEKS